MGSICLAPAALIQHLKNQCLKSILPDEVLIEFQALPVVGGRLFLKIEGQSPQRSNFILCKMLKESFSAAAECGGLGVSSQCGTELSIVTSLAKSSCL